MAQVSKSETMKPTTPDDDIDMFQTKFKELPMANNKDKIIKSTQQQNNITQSMKPNDKENNGQAGNEENKDNENKINNDDLKIDQIDITKTLINGTDASSQFTELNDKIVLNLFFILNLHLISCIFDE